MSKKLPLEDNSENYFKKGQTQCRLPYGPGLGTTQKITKEKKMHMQRIGKILVHNTWDMLEHLSRHSAQHL